jgi:hypothetical protein
MRKDLRICVQERAEQAQKFGAISEKRKERPKRTAQMRILRR